MPAPVRPKRPTGQTGLEWLLTDDGSQTLWNADLDETYHSGCGAVAESLVVYLLNSRVYQRLAQGLPTRVFEMGFGTGTGMLLTGAIANYFQTPLLYTAVEKHLLPSEFVSQLHLEQHIHNVAQQHQHLATGLSPAQFTTLPELVQQLMPLIGRLRNARLVQNGFQIDQQRLSPWVSLEMLIGDGQSLDFSSETSEFRQRFDAIYFDAFSPESCPELWTDAVFEEMVAGLSPGGVLTSYCVKGEVRRQLQTLGLTVRKAAGPVAGKREVLVAVKS